MAKGKKCKSKRGCTKTGTPFKKPKKHQISVKAHVVKHQRKKNTKNPIDVEGHDRTRIRNKK